MVSLQIFPRCPTLVDRLQTVALVESAELHKLFLPDSISRILDCPEPEELEVDAV